VPFASERSAGRKLDNGMVVVGLADDTIEGFDLAIFSPAAASLANGRPASRPRGRSWSTTRRAGGPIPKCRS
jgi:aspartate-semialdehyde dehydrogenase